MRDKNTPRGSVPIADVLPGVLARLRPAGEVPGLQELWEQWERVVGAEIARNTRPAAVKGSILLVHVSSPAWIHHLRFLKPDLLARLNAEPGRPRVTEIKFKVGAF